MHLPAPATHIRFGNCDLDPHSGELWRAGGRVLLPDQPFRILLLLLSRPNRLVTREELRCALWPGGTFVEYEHGLNAAIKRLREFIGDSATSPTYIETLPRRGYRLIAAVERVPQPLVIPERASGWWF